MQSATKADAVAAMIDSTTYFDSDGGDYGKQGGGSGKDKANEAEVPAGSVSRPLRNDAEPDRGGDHLELADN